MKKERRAGLFARVERITEPVMLVLAFIFLIVVLLPEVVPLASHTIGLLESMLWLIWGIFAAELAIKTYLAPDRRRYLISHWVDVVTVALPFLRPLRLLRLFVVVVRTWTHMRRILRRQTLSLVGITSLITIVLSATLVYAVERRGNGPIQNFPDALWWAVTTITTVGYGDMYPTTPLGRGVSVFLMLTGITLFGLLTASIAVFFVEEDAQTITKPGDNDVLDRLERLGRLREQGVLTEEEFQTQKRNVLIHADMP